MSKASSSGSHSAQPDPAERLVLLADAYLHGELSPEGLAELESLIQNDPAAVERFIAVTEQAGMMREVFTNVTDQLELVEDNETSDFLTILSELDAPEGEAPAPIDITAELARREMEAKEKERQRRRLAMAQPALPEQHRPVVIPKAIVWVGFAAALLIAAVLIQQAGQHSATVTPPVTEQAPDPAVTPPPTPAPVLATLVRTLDARWDDDASSWDGALGLREGRHVLAQGLVEIELLDGTRVVLEAPVSFELTGANTMTLATGRLVAHVPPSGYGFTVDTPTARIVDYGTEFGVHADGRRQTQVHVFQGEVRAAARVNDVVVGESVPLLQQQAAAIDAGHAAVERVAFDDAGFERRVVKRLDLVDIVAGGDGTGTARMKGLHPGTGRFDRRGILDYEQAHLVSPGRFAPVTSNPFIDGVFIPHQNHGVQVDSTGRTVSGLSVADARSYQLIWAGGLLPSAETEDRMRDVIARAYPSDPASAPVLYMISNKGITFDLDAVREAVGGSGVVRLVAEVEHTGTGGDATQAYRADFLGYLDGRPADEHRGLRPQSGRRAVTIEADASQRFLTLIVADGGDGLSLDWVVLHRPVLEVLVEETRGGPTP